MNQGETCFHIIKMDLFGFNKPIFIRKSLLVCLYQKIIGYGCNWFVYSQ